MLSIPGNTQIYLYGSPTDMRKSFRGLTTLVYQQLGRPEDGSYFVFINRRQTHVKILYSDGDGLAIWYKRLEEGRFTVPDAAGDKVEMDRRSLAMLLEGVTPLRVKKRFSLKTT